MTSATAPAGALFVGVATLDLIQQVDAAPGPNEKATSIAQLVCAGGPATNAAVCCAALGVPATLVTAVGRSTFGMAVQADLHRHRVRLVDRAAEPEEALAASAVTVSATGARSVVASNRRLAVLTADLAELVAPEHAVVLADGHYPQLALPLLATAHGQAIRVLDAGSVKPHTDELLSHVDIVVASADFRPEGCLDAADVLEHLASAGIDHALVTRGAAPVAYRWGTQRGEVDIPVVDVVDTLGAGDIFHGAFCAALVRWGALPTDLDAVDPRSLVRAASGVAARSVRSFGPRAWISERSGNLSRSADI